MNRSTNKPLQKAAKAFLHRLEGAGITLGSPRYDEGGGSLKEHRLQTHKQLVQGRYQLIERGE